MNEDNEFERKLSRQPLKQVPAGWRAEILSAVAAEARQQSGARDFTFAGANRSRLSTLGHQLASLLWPHPGAWAALAAVWVCILALNFSLREKIAPSAQVASAPSPEMVAELKSQKKMLAELIGGPELGEADRARTLSPKPHSGRSGVYERKA